MAENLVDAAKELLPMIRANLGRIDSECQLPPELAAAMAQKGLLGLYMPGCYASIGAQPSDKT